MQGDVEVLQYLKLTATVPESGNWLVKGLTS